MIKQNIVIEQAGPNQEEDVCRLWAQLVKTYGKEAKQDALQKSYRHAVSHPQKMRIYIATRGEKVVGTASLHLGYLSTWTNSWFGSVEDLIVSPDVRRQGIATKLLRYIIETGKEEKIDKLVLHTLAGNKDARAMYEKLGFDTSSVLYELPLD